MPHGEKRWGLDWLMGQWEMGNFVAAVFLSYFAWLVEWVISLIDYRLYLVVSLISEQLNIIYMGGMPLLSLPVSLPLGT